MVDSVYNQPIVTKRKCQKPIIQNSPIYNLNNQSKKSMVRLSNKELCDILENFGSRSQQNMNSSQSSLLYQTNYQNNGYNSIATVQKTNKVSQKSPETTPCYIVKPANPTKKDSETNTKPLKNLRKKVKPRNKIINHELTNDILSNTNIHFDIKKFKTRKIEEMEYECNSLERKIKLLKKNLKEMERCLELMKTVKESFSKQFDDKDDNKVNKILNVNKKITDNNIVKNLDIIKKVTIDSANDIKEQYNIDKNQQINKDKLRCTSNSNISQVSECTMVSSSFINEYSYKMITNSSQDKDKISNETTDIINSYNYSVNVCPKLEQNFFQKFWNNFKDITLFRKTTINKNNNNKNKNHKKKLKELNYDKTKTSTSIYVTAKDNIK